MISICTKIYAKSLTLTRRETVYGVGFYDCKFKINAYKILDENSKDDPKIDVKPLQS